MGVDDTSVVKPTPTGAERIKRGFNRIALVGAVVAGVAVVWMVGWYFYLSATLTYPYATTDQHPEEIYVISSFFLALGGAWVAFWMLLSWVIRGFMGEGNSNLPQGDNPH